MSHDPGLRRLASAVVLPDFPGAGVPLDDRPATMSGTVIGLLRDELDFDGVVLSDALDMRAVSAGVDRAVGREVVLVVEDRSIPATGKVVDAVLAAAPGAVIVHEDQRPDAARWVWSYGGGGAATAYAVSELLGGGV